MRLIPRLFVSVLLLLVSALIHAQTVLEEVRLQLTWKHQFQFAGYYMAVEKGFYRDAGLSVELIEVDPDRAPLDQVMSGRAEFGVGRSSLLLDKLHGVDVVALMAAFQHSPLMLLTRADSGIADPGGLRGKRIMVTDDAVQVSEVIAMMLKFGITLDDIQVQEPSYDIADLIEGRTDAMASYVSNEPFQMERRGIDYNLIHPQDYGFPMYSDILFTRGDLADARFDMVLRFRDASIKGWMYAFENIEETADVILAHYNTQQRSREALIFEGSALRALAFDDQGRFGTLSPDRFNSMASIYRIATSVDPDADLSGMLLCCTASASMRFTPFQRYYLRNFGPVRVCENRDWEPLQWLKDEKSTGLLAEYVEHIISRIGLDYHVVSSDSWQSSRRLLAENRCDLIAGIMSTVPSGDPLYYSRPFMTTPMVAVLGEAVSDDGGTIAHPKLLPGPVGVLRHHDLDRLLLRRFPELQVMRVETVEEGVEQVRRGRLSAFVDARLTLELEMQRSGSAGLVLDAALSDSFELGFAAHGDQAPLIRLLDIALTDVGHEEREQILSRWQPVEASGGIDEALVRNVLIGILVLALLAGYRFYLI
ncbi:MAG: ABC transporter substrate-binding protein, partial [Oceanospirillales bacterium]|nr:ABC transporter substrate-binding protein [Oceanospirillales bacterium]